MKRLFGNIFLLLATVVGCGKEEDPFDFLSCRLTSVVATGSATYTDNYTYDNSGRKTSVVRLITGESEVYEYNGKKIVRVEGNYSHDYDYLLPCIREIIYDSDKILKVSIKNPANGSLAYTEDYEWSTNALSVTRKDASSNVLLTHAYEFNGKDITKEVYTLYDGITIWWKEEWIYSDFDKGFNPEYLIEYPFLASLHNYNRLVITTTDYSGGTPISEIITLDYTVTLNESNAVEYRERVRNDGATLVRNYSYENCK